MWVYLLTFLKVIPLLFKILKYVWYIVTIIKRPYRSNMDIFVYDIFRSAQFMSLCLA